MKKGTKLEKPLCYDLKAFDSMNRNSQIHQTIPNRLCGVGEISPIDKLINFLKPKQQNTKHVLKHCFVTFQTKSLQAIELFLFPSFSPFYSLKQQKNEQQKPFSQANIH